MKSPVIQSILIKILALVAFVAINLIGYKAFSHDDVGPKSEPMAAEAVVESKTPTCQLAPEGYVQNKWKNIRIQIDNAVVVGAETLSDLGAQMKKLVVEHKCLPLPVPCAMATEGWALGSWVKHRIVVQDLVAFGGDTTTRLFEQLGQLKKMGVCE